MTAPLPPPPGMVECRGCRQPVRPDATKCPHCGISLGSRQQMQLLLVAGVMLALLGFVWFFVL